MNDPVVRGVVENWAEKQATEYYSKGDFAVQAFGRPIDLRAVRPERTIHVEVKGTTGDGSVVRITENERLHAREALAGRCGATVRVPEDITCSRTDLFVVADIEVDTSTDPPKASGGHCWVLTDWDPGDATSDASLRPEKWFWETQLDGRTWQRVDP